MLHLLSPKLNTVRARMRARDDRKGARILVLAIFGFAFWALAFGMLHRILAYFQRVPEIGALLAGKLLGVVLVSFFSILLLSNIITALSSFFLARDLDLLAASPADWLPFYGAKLTETTVNSSWMVLLMAVPLLSAYGIVYGGGPAFALLAATSFLPFLIIPAALGSAVTLLLVNAFPARRTRDILSVIAVLAAAGVVVLVRIIRPEKLARPEGFRSLVDFIAVLRGPTSPYLPSEWLQRTLMGWLRGAPELLPLYVLWSTAAALVVLGALLHRALYARGFTKAQEGAERWARAGAGTRIAHAVLRPLGPLRRELLLKEMRLFFRDTTQWSQLILLAVLVVVYVFNIKFLPLTGEGITFFIVNVIPFLNLVLAGFVLASVAARFIFPGVSLEGRTWWLLRASPMSMREMLWAKFWIGTLPLLVLAIGIVGVTDTLLHVSPFMFTVSIFTVTLLTFALAGLAVGFGTLFPRFETENAAQIPTSFGGMLYMMTAIATIGAVVVLEARPVYSYLALRTFGSPAAAAPVGELIIGFGTAALVCLLATFWPLRIAVRRLEAIER
jgi:ABC-2 type transport system permease protein